MTLRNEADFSIRVDGFAADAIPFNLERFDAVDGENALFAFHDREPRRAEGCWLEDDIRSAVPVVALLDATQEIEGPFKLFGGRGDPEPEDTCLEAGEYRATQQVSVYRDEGENPEFPRESTLSLRLSLSSS